MPLNHAAIWWKKLAADFPSFDMSMTMDLVQKQMLNSTPFKASKAIYSKNTH